VNWKLIVSDVDGCISPEESAAWDLDPFVALARRIRGDGVNRVPFTLCTGRPQPYVEVLAKLLDIRLPLICENGAVIYELASNHSTPGPGVEIRSVAFLRSLRGHLETLLPEYTGAAIQFGKEAQLSVYSADPEAIPHLASAAQDYTDRESPGSVRIDSSHYYLNISITGVDKGTALAWLQSRIGVGPQETAVIGDTGGDLAMREYAAFFGAPANATESVKAEADRVSAKSDVHAVHEFLDQFGVE
jgi:HAD superfamily hydrolase (TIGR01484 family)